MSSIFITVNTPQNKQIIVSLDDISYIKENDSGSVIVTKGDERLQTSHSVDCLLEVLSEPIHSKSQL